MNKSDKIYVAGHRGLVGPAIIRKLQKEGYNNIITRTHKELDLRTSHVLPALIRKVHEAKVNNKPSVEIWGTGKPRREFLYVDDLADACLYLMNNYDYKDIGEFVNIGTGKDVTIKELAEIISSIVGYKGKIKYNPSMPDGTPQKLLDVSRLNNLGWRYKTELEEGIRKTYEWFLENIK